MARKVAKVGGRKKPDATVGIIFLDDGLKIRSFTPVTSDVFNIRDIDVGHPLGEITSRLTYDNLVNDAQDVLRTLRPREVEVQREDGRWYGIRILPYLTAQNAVGGLVMSFLDINEQKQAAEDLREARDYLDNLFNYANAPIIVWNPRFEITRFNHAFERLTGRSAEEVLGQKVDILIPPDQRNEALDKINRTTAKGERWEVVEIPILHADGSFRTVLWNSATLFDTDGKTPVGTIAQGVDITERKKAEEELRVSQHDLNRAQAVARTGSWRLDVQTHELLWSDETHRIFGVPKGTPLTYATFLSSVHPEDRQCVDRKWQAALHGEPYEIDHRVVVGNDVKWVREKAEIEFDQNGALKSGFGTAQDITEQKGTEVALRRRTLELEAANKDLEAFSHSVSHDLRAPLRSLDGFSEAVLEDYGDKLDEQGKDYLNRIRRASLQMSELIDDLLKLSTVSRSEMHFYDVNLSEMARHIAEELQRAEPERKAEFVIAPDITVQGDEPLLRSAMQNLLGNAWKFTRKRPETRIEFGVTQHDGQKAYFVRDNGVGFDMRYADKLFQPFQRLHSGKEYEGTGIGLATVQRIVRRHGGRVWAEGELSKGATFYFTLGQG